MNIMYLSEDEIRTKLVYEWLKDCGFSASKIKIEYSFKVKLGRADKEIHPRSDVLIKSDSMANLLIVEVKAPSHKLEEADISQAISYSRMLKDGIAPFTILTNGKETKIFDSVTREPIEGTSIPSNHPYVTAGFKATGDSLKARMEAFEYLISFSDENLLAFCQNQVEFRMKLLKGVNIFSGKKYIPSLYVERKKSLKELKEKLFDKTEPRNLLLVVGPPQHGKTCFMCHTAEKFLADNHPVLFYPAIGLSNGLIGSIQEDFEWCFGERLLSSQWIKRLNHVGETLNKRIFIFVDGWNEMVAKALEINNECQRLDLKYISIVLSTTSPSLQRLLTDEAANQTYVAERTKLSFPLLNKIVSEPLKDTSKLDIIQIGKFDNQEIYEAKEIYKNAYKISDLPNESLFFDPFYLRVACEQYTGKEIPAKITRTELIKKSLIIKGGRRNIGYVELFRKLTDLAGIFYNYDRPTDIMNLPDYFMADENLNSWIESAILALIKKEDKQFIDFYYSHDLDYAIGILYRKWNEIFDNSDEVDILNELNSDTKTESGRNSLGWFLSCPENCQYLELLFNKLNFESSFNLPAGKIISQSIVNQVIFNNNLNFQWLERHLDKLIALEMNENAHVSELPELLFSLIMSFNRIQQKELYEFWMKLLVKHDNTVEELGIQESYIFQVYGDDLKSVDGYESGTPLDITLFKNLILDEDCEIAQKASIFYTFSCPYSFLEEFPKFLIQLKELGHDFHAILEDSCYYLEEELREQYYGSFCKGWLMCLFEDEKQLMEIERESVKEEYYKMKKMLVPIINTYPVNSFSESFKNILKDLKRIGCVVDREINFKDPDQLEFDFER